MRFVDTNVLLYAVSTAEDESAKAKLARQVLQEDDLALSVQVLQEFYVQATRAGKATRISHEQAASLIEAWCRFPVQDTTLALLPGPCRDPGHPLADPPHSEVRRDLDLGQVGEQAAPRRPQVQHVQERFLGRRQANTRRQRLVTSEERGGQVVDREGPEARPDPPGLRQGGDVDHLGELGHEAAERQGGLERDVGRKGCREELGQD